MENTPTHATDVSVCALRVERRCSYVCVYAEIAVPRGTYTYTPAKCATFGYIHARYVQ